MKSLSRDFLLNKEQKSMEIMIEALLSVSFLFLKIAESQELCHYGMLISSLPSQSLWAQAGGLGCYLSWAYDHQ